MKYKKSQVLHNVHKIPELRYADCNLTSFAGAVVFQRFFQNIRLRQKISDCFRHLKTVPVYGYERFVMIILLNILFGYKHLSSYNHLKQDPIYRRIIGLKQIPAASTLTRSLRCMDRRSVQKYRAIPRSFVLSRLEQEALSSTTLDFDGSVCSTKSRTTEQTAVGFNKPKSWKQECRFIAIRQRTHEINREPLQLDLFEPLDHYYKYKVIATNMAESARKILQYHNGRGIKETVFGELKSHSYMGYIPTRRLIGNQVFMTSSILVHNLVRELQMLKKTRKLKNSQGRGALWTFETLQTIRISLMQIAGRLIRPQGRLVMTLNTSLNTQKTIESYFKVLNKTA